MGQYYNPANDIETIGRPLRTLSDKPSLADLESQLEPGELVFAVCDKLIYKIAPFLEEQRQIDDFYSQYMRGMLIGIDYYAVPAEKAMAAGIRCEIEEDPQIPVVQVSQEKLEEIAKMVRLPSYEEMESFADAIQQLLSYYEEHGSLESFGDEL